MSANPIPLPLALHRGENELPFVPYQEGATFQLLHADIEVGLWVVRLRAQPGVTIQRHKHTGEVFAFTIQGSWRYLEYPEINVAGSYLFEPAGSVHTLHVPPSNREITDVWFAIRGANLNLDAQGKVESVLDAATVLEIYLAGCRDGRTPSSQRDRSVGRTGNLLGEDAHAPSANCLAYSAPSK